MVLSEALTPVLAASGPTARTGRDVTQLTRVVPIFLKLIAQGLPNKMSDLPDVIITEREYGQSARETYAQENEAEIAWRPPSGYIRNASFNYCSGTFANADYRPAS